MSKYTTHVSRRIAERLEPSLFPKETCVISINDPGAADGVAKLSEGWHDVLRVIFWDVVEKLDGLVWGKDAAVDPMTKEQGKEIADFIKRNWDRSIIVHCRAGISRSAAVAEILFQLGWEDFPPIHRSPFMFKTNTSLANIHVIRLLREEFPEKFGLLQLGDVEPNI